MAQLRIAPSLGQLEGDPHEVWGLKPYTNHWHDTVFMGFYSLNDVLELRQHKGKAWVFWCGSDIRHFINGYWLDDTGKQRVSAHVLASWLQSRCEHWVENTIEKGALASVGIDAAVCPSFMGNVDEYEISYEPNGKYYASVSGDDFELYGWNEIERLAELNSMLEFHLYGNTVEWPTKHKNVIVHGRVEKKQMNEEIKHMQGGLRLLEFDGFSEILAKSVLWGQWPVSTISYPWITSYLKDKHPKPNIKARDYYRNKLNQFPWNVYKKTH